jgi:uncharacterized protein YndB with AHSA1/START domain
VKENPATLHIIGTDPVLRLERRLAHPPGKVWRAVTDPAEMAHWFPARIETELKVGAPMRFTFEGDDKVTHGEILEFDPPKVFVFRWNDDVLRLELLPDGPGCRLVFSHTHSAAGGGRLGAGRNAAGWDQCLAALSARLDGRPGEEPEEEMFRRIAAYVERFGLAEGEVLDHSGGHLIRFERDLVWRPVAAVWELLTSPGPDGPERPVVGAPPPQRFTNAYVPVGPITEVDPPHVLEYDWPHDGDPAGRVRWELTEDPKAGNRVIITQTVPARLADLRATALAAWQIHLELLFAALFGSEQPWPAERTEQLQKTYAERLS